jgi:hypothetical protein
VHESIGTADEQCVVRDRRPVFDLFDDLLQRVTVEPALQLPLPSRKVVITATSVASVTSQKRSLFTG